MPCIWDVFRTFLTLSMMIIKMTLTSKAQSIAQLNWLLFSYFGFRICQLFHDKYQSYKYEKIQQGNLLAPSLRGSEGVELLSNWSASQNKLGQSGSSWVSTFCGSCLKRSSHPLRVTRGRMRTTMLNDRLALVGTKLIRSKNIRGRR